MANEKEPEFLALNGCKQIANRRKWSGTGAAPVLKFAQNYEILLYEFLLFKILLSNPFSIEQKWNFNITNYELCVSYFARSTCINFYRLLKIKYFNQTLWFKTHKKFLVNHKALNHILVNYRTHLRNNLLRS